MSRFFFGLLFAFMCSAQNLTVISACCESFPQLQFVLGTPAQSVTLSYGFVSTQLALAAGSNPLQVGLPTTGVGTPPPPLYTSSIMLSAGSDYTMAFYGPFTGGSYQVIGPALNMTMGDNTNTKLRMRFLLVAPYVEQGNPTIHLQALCPSVGATPIFDITGVYQDFSPAAPNYVEKVQASLQDNCQLRVVKIDPISGATVPLIQKTFFLSVGNNYTVVAVGQDSSTADEKLIVDSHL